MIILSAANIIYTWLVTLIRYRTITSSLKMRELILLFSLTLLFQDGYCVERNHFNPIINTPLGEIEGHVGLTVNLNPFYKFEGIPYAKPPIGELRFEPPQNPDPWVGIWKAKVLTRCMQYDHYNEDSKGNYVVHGDEDCLYINIYTHSTSPTANLDVLLFIHGGAFMFGRGASYGPEIVMDRNIVFVNFNYRLGALGFLSTEDDVLPGNLGLRDQIKALKWVKENIKYFGGNPNSITIYGLSAGGSSVHLHYLMPQSKGIFKQGISQSGCALNPWVLIENIGEKTAKIADYAGCPTRTSNEIKECLKSKPARHIVEAVKIFQPFLYNPFSPLGVVVDGKWSKNPLLADHPYNLLKHGQVLDVPWITSYTSAEGLYPGADFWTNDQYLNEIDSKWNEIVPFILHYNDSVDPNKRDEISQKIRHYYLGDNLVNRNTFSKLIDIIGDRLFVADIDKAARLHNLAVKSNVYVYTFTYRGAASKTDPRTKSTVNLGTAHGDDTIYVLNNELNTTSNAQDRQMSKVMLDMIQSFMQTGTPNITSIWQPMIKSKEDSSYLQLKISGPDDLQMEAKQEIGESAFWDSLDFKENHRFDDRVLEKDEL